VAINRLAVTLTTQEAITEPYLYSFAFDDDNDRSDGPVAIVSSTTIPNGVVGGSFTVLVQYQNGQYSAYRRTALANGGERLDRALQAFVTVPTSPTGRTLSFTLDLDARTVSGERLFDPAATELNTNFITTTERRLDPNDNRRKSFDAFGPGQPAAYTTFEIGPASRYTYTNSTSVGEPANDVDNPDFSSLIKVKQLDITNFTIDVRRSN
ncbi:MAG TPA: hypothetical protein VF719_11165, partial [Abditibacteriaceae bacterium]